jgi:hypothetical protein
MKDKGMVPKSWSIETKEIWGIFMIMDIRGELGEHSWF